MITIGIGDNIMAPIRLRWKLLWFLIFINLIEFVFSSEDPDLIKLTPANSGRGFGSHILWLDYEKALQVAMLHQKPIMLIIHKSWCSACKALKPQFAGSREIAELSEKFVMVNSGDSDEPTGDKKFAPDGDYIPRILFLSPDGELRLEFYNEAGDPSYKYFYADTWSIVATMQKVARTYKRRTRPVRKDVEL